jgi:hypothetical protein
MTILPTPSASRVLDNHQNPQAEPRQCEALDRGDSPVPTETIILLVIVVAIFLVFAGVLAWGDRQTCSLPVKK